jgi:hypothetical protein
VFWHQFLRLTMILVAACLSSTKPLLLLFIWVSLKL